MLPPSIFKTGSLNRPAGRVRRGSERKREELPPSQRQGKRGKAPPPPPQPPPPLLSSPLLSPPVPSARRSPTKKQVSLFHFLAAGEGERTNEERTNEPPMIVLHDATPTNVRTPTMARCGAAGGLAGQTCKTWQNVPSPVFHPSFLAASLSSEVKSMLEIEHCA